MSIIKPKKEAEKEKLKIEIEKDIFNEIEQYNKWAHINSIDDFIEGAIQFILSKDSDWKKHKKSLTKSKNIKDNN